MTERGYETKETLSGKWLRMEIDRGVKGAYYFTTKNNQGQPISMTVSGLDEMGQIQGVGFVIFDKRSPLGRSYRMLRKKGFEREPILTILRILDFLPMVDVGRGTNE